MAHYLSENPNNASWCEKATHAYGKKKKKIKTMKDRNS